MSKQPTRYSTHGYLACGVDSCLPPGLYDAVPSPEGRREHVALVVHGGYLVCCGLQMLLGGGLAPGLEVARNLRLVFLSYGIHDYHSIASMHATTSLPSVSVRFAMISSFLAMLCS